MLGDEALLSEEVESQTLLWVSNVRMNFLFLLCKERRKDKEKRGEEKEEREGEKGRREGKEVERW